MFRQAQPGLNLPRPSRGCFLSNLRGTARLNIDQNERLFNSKRAEKFFSQFNTQKFRLRIKIFMSNCIAGFFYRKYFQRELISLLDFLLKKVTKETTNIFNWV